MEDILPNQGKNLIIEVAGVKYERYPFKTHVISDQDNMVEVLKKYLSSYWQPDDMIFISEKIVAINQGRAYPIKDIHPSKLAYFLLKFVHKSPYGIGIASPWTMELAIREAGYPKLFLGLIASAITKPFGIKGVFYRICGKTVAAIDGPADYVLPPYNKYAKLGPLHPDKTAKELKEAINYEVVIIDANDIGVSVLGKSNKDISDKWACAVFKDNPLGQTNQQTPLCLVRKVK